ncbi:hypothetical protein A5N15_01280 [Rothia kristinae]|uniref:Uncharacterized protein n=1 Tax=Rothia kristinae TaxID=37923 RepID=A0A657IX41_9MICC|nr:hypothetical protein A5N15_01280 [Rothia kristinae]
MPIAITTIVNTRAGPSSPRNRTTASASMNGTQDIVNTAAMMEGSIPSRGPAIRHSTTTITAASTE